MEITKILAIIILSLLILNIIYNNYIKIKAEVKINENIDLNEKEKKEWKNQNNLNVEFKLKNINNPILKKIISIVNLEGIYIFLLNKDIDNEESVILNIKEKNMNFFGLIKKIPFNVSKINELDENFLLKYNINNETVFYKYYQDNKNYYLFLNENVIIIEENNQLYIIEEFYEIETFNLFDKTKKININTNIEKLNTMIQGN